MVDDTTIALLEAHESIIVEREEANREMELDDKFVNGHVNGLNEARNRVVEIILERVNDNE